MLIKFKVENFRSFGKEVEFSYLATPERGHRDRVFEGRQAGLRLLTVGAIYGANASGKSNLFRAIELARKLVVSGVALEAPIPVQPFRLNAKWIDAPTRFYFEVLVKDQVFAYRFAVNAQAVVEESLTEIRPASGRLIFSREVSAKGETTWDLKHFENKDLNAGEIQFVEFVAKGTPRNQLFLMEAHSRNVIFFNDLWDWFRNSLVLVQPNATIPGLEFKLQQKDLHDFCTRFLHGVDVEIDRLGTKPVSLDSINLPKEVRQNLENNCKEGMGAFVMNGGNRLSFRREKGELKAAKQVSYHKVDGRNESVAFDIEDESDGTRRLLDFLPIFYELANPKTELVVFVDEFDRSLHSKLTRALIENYLACQPTNARSQLLFTTHDATLLDHELLRKDEIWLVDKNEKRESELSSLGDFKLRSDKRLMKDYLLGRFGGVPNIQRLPLSPTAILATVKED